MSLDRMMGWIPVFRDAEGAASGGGGDTGAGAEGSASPGAAALSAPPAGQGGDGAPPPAGGEGEKPWFETITMDETQRNTLLQNGFHKAAGDDGAPRTATLEEAFARTLSAYDNASRKLGAKPGELIRAPGQDSDLGAWLRENGKALGVPDSVEGYQIERPQMPQGMTYDEALEKEALAALHEAGAPQHLAQRMVGFWAERQARELEGVEREAASSRQEMMAELAKDWGGKTEAKTAQASRAFQHFAEKSGLPPESVQGLAASFASQAGDARAIRFFAAIAEAMGEDRLALPGGGPGGAQAGPSTPAEARARLDQITGQSGEYAKASAERDRRRMEALSEEISRLSKLAAQGGQ